MLIIRIIVCIISQIDSKCVKSLIRAKLYVVIFRSDDRIILCLSTTVECESLNHYYYYYIRQHCQLTARRKHKKQRKNQNTKSIRLRASLT